RRVLTRVYLDASFTTYSDVRTEYDAAGRPVVTYDATGQPTTITYDADGQAMQTTYADNSFTATHYDADGRQDSVTDPLGRVTQYLIDYQGPGRVETVVQPAVANPAGGTTNPRTVYRYDVYGNQVSVTDANGHVTTYEYDEFGHQVSRTLPAV